MSGDKSRIKLPKLPQQPRSKDEITKEYSQAMQDLATSTYLRHVYTVNVDNLNHQLVNLNKELKARNDLDAPKEA